MHPRILILLCATLAVVGPSLPAADGGGYRSPSPALAAIVDAPIAPLAILSPDRRLLLMLERADAPSIAELAQPELRLAGLRINPATNGPSRASRYTGIYFKPLDGGAERRVSGLPAGAKIGDYEWSRDSRHLAITLVRENGIELWLITADAGAARRLTGPPIIAQQGKKSNDTYLEQLVASARAAVD